MLRIRSPVIIFLNKSFNGLEFRQNALMSSAFSSSSSSAPLDKTKTTDRSDGVQKSQSSGKPIAREPLAKNFFVGVVDNELLAYPEVITREDMSRLRDSLTPVKNFIAESVDLQAIEATKTIPPEVMKSVRDFGLYGLNVPHDFGGSGWEFSGSLMAAEEESYCSDLALTLLSHRVVVDALIKLGTQQQKERFLPKLASGAVLASEAIYEYNMPEFDFFNTTADYHPDDQTWTINGAKSFVVTGPRAAGSTHLFLVIAQTKRSNIEGEASRASTIFLVDSACEGVEVGEQHKNFGCRSVQTSTVHFRNVIVPNDCVLGERNQANILADKLLTFSRLRQALIGMVMGKNVLNDMTHYFLQTKQCGVALSDVNINQTHLTKAMCTTYAAESMIYMSAGLLDNFEAQDVALEAAITKYFTMRELRKTSNKFMDFLGPKSLLAGQLSELVIRNSAHLYTMGETMDMLSMYIATAGLQHAGPLLQASVTKSRNPLFHPMHIMANFLNSASVEKPKIKKEMRLQDHLHLSLNSSAHCIEESVARLQMAVELLFNRYGATLVEHHNELQRLTEMVVHIYAMYASVSRASRSYCIGLYLADHELLLATSFSQYCTELVKALCQEVFAGKFLNNDNNYMRLGKRVAKKKGYFAVHPLTYNF